MEVQIRGHSHHHGMSVALETGRSLFQLIKRIRSVGTLDFDPMILISDLFLLEQYEKNLHLVKSPRRWQFVSQP